MMIAFLTVGTMGLSNTSLGYLNYPTQVIFKCCKLIPVMIGGVFIQGQLLSISSFIFNDLFISYNILPCHMNVRMYKEAIREMFLVFSLF